MSTLSVSLLASRAARQAVVVPVIGIAVDQASAHWTVVGHRLPAQKESRL